jgi:hypothetical protein
VGGVSRSWSYPREASLVAGPKGVRRFPFGMITHRRAAALWHRCIAASAPEVIPARGQTFSHESRSCS